MIDSKLKDLGSKTHAYNLLEGKNMVLKYLKNPSSWKGKITTDTSPPTVEIVTYTQEGWTHADMFGKQGEKREWVH
jgi:hypothetical protein